MKNPLLPGIVLLCILAACKKSEVLPSPINPTDTTTLITYTYYAKDTTPRQKGLVAMSAAQYQSLPYFDQTTLDDIPTNGNVGAIPLPRYALSIPMVNQRNIPASAAFAAGFAVKSYNYFASHYPLNWYLNSYPDTTKLFNPLFIYNQLPQEKRRNLYDVFEFLKEQGISNMQDMPFYYDRDTTRVPTAAAQANALNHKIAGAYRIKKYDIDLLKKLVYVYGHPVVIGVTIDNAYERLSKACFRGQNMYDTGSRQILTWHKYLEASDPSANPAYDMQRSLQTMVITGYDDDKEAFLVWNPWGALWGNEGFMWIDYTFLKDALMYNDAALKPVDPYAFVMVETNAVSLKDGLVAWYPFDGDVTDKSGNNNTGLLAGNAVLGTDRNNNPNSNAIHFGGVAAPGSLFIKNSQSLQFYQDMSISLWVKIKSKTGLTWNGTITTDSARMNLFTKSPVKKGLLPVRDNFEGMVSFFEFNGHTPNCGIKNKIWGQAVNYNQDLFIEYCNGQDTTLPGDWFHIVQVYRRSGESELWINNHLFMHSQFVRADFYASNQSDLIFSNEYPLDGALDDIRIYNKALTPQQIASLARQ